MSDEGLAALRKFWTGLVDLSYVDGKLETEDVWDSIWRRALDAGLVQDIGSEHGYAITDLGRELLTQPPAPPSGHGGSVTLVGNLELQVIRGG